jgi:ubiquinone/menaquinone biosynthesis C-methylase UbiE
MIGGGCEQIALLMPEDSNIFLILNDYESLLNSRLVLGKSKHCSVKMMSYENTDFKQSEFDIVYAQASISTSSRNKILNEIKRILKDSGYLSIGEIVKLSDQPPKFVTDVWSASGIVPLSKEELTKLYLKNHFEILDSVDLSFTLKNFYSESQNQLKEVQKNISEQERSYYKKLLNKISHESNAYLKLGGDKHIGFISFILRKIN